MRDLFGDRFWVYSAGVASGGLNPYAVRVLQESGIDVSVQSKSIREYKGMHFDYIVTLCDTSQSTLVRYLPDGRTYIHHSFPVIAEVGVDWEEILKNFRVLRDEIKGWLVMQSGG